MRDFSVIVKLLKEASPFDLFLVSFIALPFVISAWLTIFENLGFQDKQLLNVVVGVVVAYSLGILAMVLGATSKKNRELAKDQIIEYLQSQDFEMMSFERVRQKINSSYKNSFLESVIDSFPKDLRRATLKGGKRGVARIIVETDAEEKS